MRLPEKPPSDEELQKLLVGITDPATIARYRQYVDIVNNEYLHWDELPVDTRFKGINLKELWSIVKLVRGFNARIVKFNGTTLTYIQTPNIEKSLHDLDMRVGGKIVLEAQIPGPELRKKYLVNSLMEEAIASSQLEGAATTRAVAKKMLRENRKPRNPSERMIVNNYITMRYIKEHSEPRLTIDFIKEIHRKITNGTLEEKQYEGMFRTDNEVKVLSRDDGTQIYDPPDYKLITQFLEQVCNFANSEPVGYYLNPFVKAILLHYMIGYIHPFNDGNGRTARALFYWYLIVQKYDYLEYVAVSTAIKNAPARYTFAYLYAETDNNDVTYFVKFNLRQIDIAVRSFEKYVEKTKTETKKIFEAIQHNPKMNFRQADILITMSKNEQPITISEMKERYSITYETARTDLYDLVRREYLHKIIQGKQFVFLLDKEKCLSDGTGKRLMS
jgi:Fic family protein